MNFDLPPTNESQPVPFERKQYKEGIEAYIFEHVAVAIDTTGKNYKDLPELYFGTFDSEDNIKESFHQPEIKREGVNMEYIAKCVDVVANDSGIHEFWFYPFGEDTDPENKDNREQARLRLFQRLGDISPAPNGFGYILKV